MVKFLDQNFESIIDGERYAVGRGSRVRKWNKSTSGYMRQDQDGRWVLHSRDGQLMSLGIPGELDADGVSAEVAFVRLDSDWEAVDYRDGQARSCRLLLDEIEQKNAEILRLREGYEANLAHLAKELTADERDAIFRFVYDSQGREVVEAILSKSIKQVA